MTTGPLGQGFANAVGLAIAEAHLAAVYNREQTIVDHHTYVIAGDGDLMEGVASEAASLAGHLALGKLIVLYDDNKVSLAAATDVTFTEDVRERFEAYGWHTIEVGPGEANDVDAIDRAIAEAKAETLRPTLIAVRSTIGYGSPEAGTFKTHGEPLGKNMEATRKALHWDYPPFVDPRRARGVLQGRRREGRRRCKRSGTRATLRGKPRTRSSPRSSSARATASCPPICRGRRSTPRTAASRRVTPAVR